MDRCLESYENVMVLNVKNAFTAVSDQLKQANPNVNVPALIDRANVPLRGFVKESAIKKDPLFEETE
jgi:hypothetical protein